MASLERNANAAVNFPNAFGVTARFAMKACPNAAILQYLSAKVPGFFFALVKSASGKRGRQVASRESRKGVG